MEQTVQEQERIEQLLKPRYKLIADYPGCSFEVGTILESNNEGELYSKRAGFSWTVSRIMLKDINKFKHLIKSLEWHEERSIGEMPPYVKWIKGDDMIGRIEKVESWEAHPNSFRVNLKSQLYAIRAEYFEPATHADYLATTHTNQEK